MRNERKSYAFRVGRAVYFILIFLAIYFVFNALPAFLYYASLISLNTLNFVASAALSFSLSGSAIAYLLFVDRKKKSVASRLGLGSRSFSLGNVLLGVLIFFIIFAMEMGVSLVSSVTGVQINTNANTLLVGAPIWFYVFASIIAPLNEELLFRGLMVPRVGIVLSAILFALPHLTYDSSFFIEVIAALVFGLLAGYAYKRTNSLYPSLVAHMLVNILTVVGVLYS